MLTIDINNIESVYSGINGRCCCGCSGKHSYASEHVEAAGKNRGYAIKEEEVNDSMVKKVLGIIAKAQDVNVGRNFLSTVVGRRLYVLYIR